ncbi:MAG: cyclic-di-AMP receptor [Bacillota bacterium]
MKLIVAVIHDEDSHDVIKKLSKNDYGVTKLSSTGGFLKTGNTTLMIGVDEDEVSHVIDIIKEKCQTRKEYTMATSMIGEASTFMGEPVEVTVGGATIFVLDVDNFIQV